MDRKTCLFFFLIIILILTGTSTDILEDNKNTNVNADDKCSSSFECSTGCCYDGICSEKSECKKRMLYAYLASGVITVVVLILSIVYLFIHIKGTRENVKLIREKMQKNQQVESEKMNFIRQRTTEIEEKEDDFTPADT